MKLGYAFWSNISMFLLFFFPREGFSRAWTLCPLAVIVAVFFSSAVTIYFICTVRAVVKMGIAHTGYETQCWYMWAVNVRPCWVVVKVATRFQNSKRVFISDGRYDQHAETSWNLAAACWSLTRCRVCSLFPSHPAVSLTMPPGGKVQIDIYCFRQMIRKMI